jgi:hypothetical protein
VARLARIAFWCDEEPPRRGPLVGLGISNSRHCDYLLMRGRPPYQVGPGRRCS